MRSPPFWRITGWKRALLLTVLLLPIDSHGGLFYKDYLLRTDRGDDLLCAPYVVQPNDWVYKILKLRGEIASADFPEFLETFRRLNPEVDDINTIRPGQQILIPLRAVRREELPPVAPSGTVTIPFVQSAVPCEQDTYTVQPGDCVSKLLAENFGNFGSSAYRQATVLFRRLNPHVSDLNRIYPGQKLILRDTAASSSIAAAAESPPPKSDPAGDLPRQPDSDLSRLAELLDAQVLSRGRYFFPRPGGSDLTLDLSRHPLIVLADGTRLLLAGDTPPAPEVLAAARHHWPRLNVVATTAEASIEDQIEIWMAAMADRQTQEPLTFVDGGVEVTVRAPWVLRLTPASSKAPRYLCVTPVAAEGEKTPETVLRYLEAHGIRLKEVVRPPTGVARSPVITGQVPVNSGTILPRVLCHDSARRFVADLLPAIGFAYAQNVQITFPYAGLQIQAVSNVVHPPRGAPLFIDFGELYGEAFGAIQATGFRILHINRDLPNDQIVEKVLTALETPFERQPTFLVAARSKDNNIELRIPGVLRLPSGESGGHLITPAEIDERLRRFLVQRRIAVLGYGYSPVASAQRETVNR